MPVQSPCVDICKLDPATGFCIGCLRTRDEIRGWKTMTDDERLTVLEGTFDRVVQPPQPAAPATKADT